MGGKNCKAIAFSLLLFLGLSACKKEPSTPAPVPETEGQRKVFIVCEGAFGNGNSSMSLYLPEKDSVYEDIFNAVNGTELGDVFQSMTRMGNLYYLCLNNSDKVLSLNSDFTINKYHTVPKPRYVQQVSAGKAYVTSMYHNRVYILNTAAQSVAGYLELGGMNTEGMAVLGDKAYISTWDTSVNKIYVINTTTDALTDSITIAGYAPQEVLVDREQKLWVLSGNVAKGKPAAWTRLDSETGDIIKSYHFPVTADPLHPVMNNTKDTLYFIEVNYNGGSENNGIYRMSINDATLPAAPFISAQQFQYYWGLGIEPVTGDIYVGDPKGFIQKGSVKVYSPDGTKKTEFPVGVGPGHFYFEQ